MKSHGSLDDDLALSLGLFVGRTCARPLVSSAVLLDRNPDSLRQRLTGSRGELDFGTLDVSNGGRSEACTLPEFRLREASEHAEIGGVRLIRAQCQHVRDRDIESSADAHQNVDLRRVSSALPELNGAATDASQTRQGGNAKSSVGAMTAKRSRVEPPHHSPAHLAACRYTLGHFAAPLQHPFSLARLLRWYRMRTKEGSEPAMS